MAEFTLPTHGGRQILLRPIVAAPRPMLSLALVSTYGNIIESVDLEAGDGLILARGTERIVAASHQQFDKERCRRDIAARKREREALARNPWQSLTDERGYVLEGSLLDRLSRAQGAAEATHCPSGHALTPENTYLRMGRKACRTCRRERNVWDRDLQPKDVPRGT